ncbi:MAG: polyprenol monophosphomannose synthase [bacterium]
MYNLVIIMPTYNEKANLEKLLPQIKKQFTITKISGGVLIIDDNSPDGTSAYVNKIILDMSDSNFFIKLRKRPGKLGLGTAYIQGYKQVFKEMPSRYILGMDADFSHDPKYIPEIYQALKDNDVVIGSRYVPGGGTLNWGIVRRIISRLGGLYSKILLWWPVNDPTTAFTGFRSDALKQLDLERVQAENYGFNIELKYQAYMKKLRIKEVPIIFADRVAGKSKFSIKIFFEGIFNTLTLRIKYRNFK